MLIIIIIIITIVQETPKQCGPICFVEGKITFYSLGSNWFDYWKSFKTYLIGDEKRRYSVWPYIKMVTFHSNADDSHTECITAVWEQIYLYHRY